MNKKKALQLYGPVIGEMTPAEARRRLSHPRYKELSTRTTVPATGKFANFTWPGGGPPKPWQYTSHAFGFIGAGKKFTGEPLDILNAGDMDSDKSLKNSKVKVALSRLRVFDYPGGGEHQILFDFWGQNQLQTQAEDVHFTQTYRVRQGEMAGIIGYPIFIGLNVSNEGLDFHCHTVNVKNTEDQKMIDFLDGDVFKKGLSFLNAVNPAVPVVTSFALGITKAILSRNENIGVQDFFMGLDFSNIPTNARLAEGAYIAIQVPDPNKWDWTEWVYNPKTGQVGPKSDPTGPVPYNYIIFSVSKLEA